VPFFTGRGLDPDFKAAQTFTDTFAVFHARDRHQIEGAEVVLVMNEDPSDADLTLDLLGPAEPGKPGP